MNAVTGMDSPEEQLDVVDATDSVVRSISRKEVPTLLDGKSGYVRGVLVFLINKRGEVYIPKRSRLKKIAPNGLDCSASGHVKAGFRYEDAAIEELSEELDVNVEETDLLYIGTIAPFEGVPYFHQLFIVFYDETPTLNPDDFCSAEWLQPDELRQLLDGGADAKGTLLPSLNLLDKYMLSSLL